MVAPGVASLFLLAVSSLLLVAVVGALLVAFGAGAKAQSAAPGVTGIQIYGSSDSLDMDGLPARGDNTEFLFGDTILLRIEFSGTVCSQDTPDGDFRPHLALTIGSRERVARLYWTEIERCDESWYIYDRDYYLLFAYNVQPEDRDPNFNLATHVAADAIKLNGANILAIDLTTGLTTGVNLDLTKALSEAIYGIDGSIGRTPKVTGISLHKNAIQVVVGSFSDNAQQLRVIGHEIEVHVRFFPDVRVHPPHGDHGKRKPQLALAIGTGTRLAELSHIVRDRRRSSLDNLAENGTLLAKEMIFTYITRPEDEDEHFSLHADIAADAIILNGWQILLATDNATAADLDLSEALTRSPDTVYRIVFATEVRIIARRLVDGRVEFGLQERDGSGWADRILPPRRFFPAAGGTRWLSSSPIMVGEDTEVRIIARRLEDGRIEFGVQERDGSGWADRILPSQRFFPAAGGARWLGSSPVEVGGE